MTERLPGKRHLLVVDDELNLARLMAKVLTEEGYEVSVATTGESGLALAMELVPEVVLLDLKLPDLDGMALLRALKERLPETMVVMVTAHGTIQLAVEAMRQGAEDFITKPFTHDQLRLVVHKVLEKRRLAEENFYLREQLESRFGLENLVGQSPAMQKVFFLIRRAAQTNARVLILGESGTGKELVARAIHKLSARREGPFIPMNCAAIPETLLESELFGYERGAFTGAMGRHIGRFEAANGGTLFLDEIGEMPLGMQVKLLRVLQEGEVQRLGGNRPVRVDVRVIAATNLDLEKALAEGKLREDLYFRLNVIQIKLPPLRERKEDLELLVEHFLRKYAPPGEKWQIAPSALAALKAYHWPGNVRELENAIERALVISRGRVIEVDCLPPEIIQAAGGEVERPQPERLYSLKELERRAIAEALLAVEGNRQKAAQLLGISVRSLQYKIKEYGLTDSRSKSE
ncbi:MAG: sigma-54 dependent transcriptional regulator [Bacillota bacterium]|nr:sigma-54 dependent transcriptional regulator [Bacillota bacterium]